MAVPESSGQHIRGLHIGVRHQDSCHASALTPQFSTLCHDVMGRRAANRAAALADRPRSPHAEGMAGLLNKLKSKRRWVQFSLRTEFILVTALCVGLSLWIVPLERKRRAVAAIEALNGEVTYRPPPTGEFFHITFLRRWIPQAYFDEVTELNLTNTRVMDASLAQLQGLTNLRLLNLCNTQITDAGLVHLKGLTGLQELYLTDTHVTDVGLAHLRGRTSLQGLNLANNQVTDAGLVHLQGFTSLERLNLYKTQVTDAGVAKLRQVLPSCQIYRP